jgi:hypothetical protein
MFRSTRFGACPLAQKMSPMVKCRDHQARLTLESCILKCGQIEVPGAPMSRCIAAGIRE